MVYVPNGMCTQYCEHGRPIATYYSYDVGAALVEEHDEPEGLLRRFYKGAYQGLARCGGLFVAVGPRASSSTSCAPPSRPADIVGHTATQ
jgi:hypothetical protein